MEKGFGIGALVLAIMATFVPLLGPWLTVVAALFAMFAYGPGFGMAVGALIVNLVNLLFLSPTTWIYLSGETQGSPVIPIIWIGAQVIGFIVLWKRNKLFAARAPQ